MDSGSDDQENQGFSPGPGENNKQLKMKLKISSGSSSSSQAHPHQLLEPTDQNNNNINSIVVVAASSSPAENKNNGGRIACPVCKKEFGSGKALGGHMRIHAQNFKKQQRQKKLLATNQPVHFKKYNDNNNQGRASDGMMKFRSVCSICSKRFPSMKSLFGHMRCHPERDWRGIKPPQDHQFPESSNAAGNIYDNDCSSPYYDSDDDSDDSDDDDDDDEEEDEEMEELRVLDLSEDLPKWGNRAMRGRRAADDDSDLDDSEETMKFDMVSGLISLRQGHSSDSSGISTLAATAVSQDHRGMNVALQVANDSSGTTTLAATPVSPEHRDMNVVLDQLQVTNNNNLSTVSNRGQEFVDHMGFSDGGFEQVSKKEKMRSSGKVYEKLRKEKSGAGDPSFKEKLRMENSTGIDSRSFMEKLRLMQKDGTDHRAIKSFGDHMEQVTNAEAARGVGNNDESDGRKREYMRMSNGGRKYFDGTYNDRENGEMGSSKTKRVKKLKLMIDIDQEKAQAAGGSLVGASTGTEKYRCNTCNKTFPTHQALGGHRSSHNKFKLTIINADAGNTNLPYQSSSVSALGVSDHHRVGAEDTDQNHHQLITNPADQINRVISEESAAERQSTGEGDGSLKADHGISTIHQCTVCNKIFQSGQALGGHKRCHWTAPTDQTEVQPQAQLAPASSGEEASAQIGGTRARFTGIDLNEAPPVEEDQGVAEDAAGGTEKATTWQFF